MSEWPSNPPEPTDFAQTRVTSDLPLRNCVYCFEEISQNESYFNHITECEKRKNSVEYTLPNGNFAIVVPAKTGYVWRNKTGGFACRKVAIQGILFPLPTPRKRSGEFEVRPEIEEEAFDDFKDPEEAKSIYIKGLVKSTEYEYGGVDLGQKLVEEKLDGVYADDEDVREKKLQTLPERINAVWEMIDNKFPFTYERVAAPRGFPVTQEGLRWMKVTGKQDWVEENIEFTSHYNWVDFLAEMDKRVALFYPNSD